MSAAPRTESIARGTGVAWTEWVRLLDSADAREATHKQIVAEARRHMAPHVKNPGWWAQTVAVAYAQHLGRRQPGQRQDGTFEVSVSVTVSLTLDEALEEWLAFVSDRDTFAGIEIAQEPTVTRTATWRRWRSRLDDGSRAGLDIGSRRGSSVLTASHARLRDGAEREQRRLWWRGLLDDFARSLNDR